MTLACTAAMAQNSAVTAAVQKAIESNPEVSAKFNAFRAASDDVDIAAGAYKPKVDLTGDVGRNHDVITGRTGGDSQSLNRTGVALSATQLLWDGWTTSNDVSRSKHTKLSKYFDFVDAAEQTALETTRAYYDVQRYRTLVSLAEQNYVQHKYAFEQIQSRVKAGVTRGVDLEQSGARLALAESNLVTEKANLHDVTERYRRIVGELPPVQTSAAAPLLKPLPATYADALERTAVTSPVIASAVENMRAVKAQAESRKGAYQPRIEARLKAGAGHNYEGVEAQKRDALGQIVMNWNLYNGGIDDARQRQMANTLNQAADLRDKACRDVRQTVAIAYNDIGKLTEQMGYLERNVVAIEKARDAYRQQFDIGQRSLLDLLNAENELYTARRAYAMAAADLNVAKLRTHAGMGTLLPSLGLARDEARQMALGDEQWEAGSDASSHCPLTPTTIASTSKADLDARAKALVAPAATPAPVVAPEPPKVADVPATIAEQRLRDWAAAWMSKDINRYYTFYSQSFGPIKVNKAKWQAERKRLVTKPGDISVVLDDIRAKTLSPTRAETTFTQTYHSKDYNDQMLKTLTWQLEGKEWMIVKETNR